MPQDSVSPDPSRDHPSPYSGEQASRLASHALHVDNMLVQRGNFFLVAESMLLVAYAGLLSSAGSPDIHAKSASHIIAGFGIILAAIWTYTCHRHYGLLNHIRTLAIAHLADFANTRATRTGAGPSATPLMVYAVPGITAVMWLMLMILI